MIPKLRFQEYQSNWLENCINDIAKVTSGGTPSRANKQYWGGEIPWITTSQINFEDIYHAEEFITELGLNNSSAKLFSEGTILLALYGQGVTRGRVSVLGIDATTNQACAAIILKANIESDTRFVFYYLQANYEQIRNLANDGGQKNLSGGLVKSLPIRLPVDKSEHQKIASFLTSIDKKISQVAEKHRLLKEYKKGVMQQIFSQQIRFKDDDGNMFPEWQTKPLSSLLFEHKCKNFDLTFNKEQVLSVSGDCGVVNQIEHLGRSYAGVSVAPYHIVHEGDIVYTKSPLKGNPYGIIKANLGKAGIVSTLYAVYSCKDSAYPQYLDYYFSLDDNVNRYLRPLVHKGAKNDMKINNQRVLIDPITYPSLKEQIKITQFLKAIDNKITAITEQLEQTKQFKKGLFQQMFV